MGNGTMHGASSAPLPSPEGRSSQRRTKGTVPPPQVPRAAHVLTSVGSKGAEVEYEHCLCEAADGGIT